MVPSRRCGIFWLPSLRHPRGPVAQRRVRETVQLPLLIGSQIDARGRIQGGREVLGKQPPQVGGQIGVHGLGGNVVVAGAGHQVGEG